MVAGWVAETLFPSGRRCYRAFWTCSWIESCCWFSWQFNPGRSWWVNVPWEPLGLQAYTIWEAAPRHWHNHPTLQYNPTNPPNHHPPNPPPHHPPLQTHPFPPCLHLHPILSHNHQFISLLLISSKYSYIARKLIIDLPLILIRLVEVLFIKYAFVFVSIHLIC